MKKKEVKITLAKTYVIHVSAIVTLFVRTHLRGTIFLILTATKQAETQFYQLNTILPRERKRK